MTDDQKSSCHKIIHTASAAAAAAASGMAQLPGSDNAVIVPIQITMIVSLGKVFGKSITKSLATSLLASAGASVGGRMLSQVLVGWIPFLGNAVNATTAAGVTESIGWWIADYFDKDLDESR